MAVSGGVRASAVGPGECDPLAPAVLIAAGAGSRARAARTAGLPTAAQEHAPVGLSCSACFARQRLSREPPPAAQEGQGHARPSGQGSSVASATLDAGRAGGGGRRQARRRPHRAGGRRLPGRRARRGPGRRLRAERRASRSSTAPTARPASCATIFYDWPDEIETLIDAEKPAAVVVMLGANDRQQMRIGTTRARQPHPRPGTRNTSARADALRRRRWPTRRCRFSGSACRRSSRPKMTLGHAGLQRHLPHVGRERGGEFVDIWDGFVDENGAFVSTGPDINGQPVRLRSDDGINLTKAGKRKLAFYAREAAEQDPRRRHRRRSPACRPRRRPVRDRSTPTRSPVDRTVPCR